MDHGFRHSGIIHRIDIMLINGVQFPESNLAEFCDRHGVKRLSVFGSILRPDFRNDSDIDVLVEFRPGRTPGMFGFGAMILELSELVGRTIDLRTPYDLSPHLRPFVLHEARVLHAA